MAPHTISINTSDDKQTVIEIDTEVARKEFTKPDKGHVRELGTLDGKRVFLLKEHEDMLILLYYNEYGANIILAPGKHERELLESKLVYEKIVDPS